MSTLECRRLWGKLALPITDGISKYIWSTMLSFSIHGDGFWNTKACRRSDTVLPFYCCDKHYGGTGSRNPMLKAEAEAQVGGKKEGLEMVSVLNVSTCPQ